MPKSVDLGRRTELCFALAAVLACAAVFAVNFVDPDVWGHVQYAHDWIEEGTLPRVASHTFTAVEYPWVNHENLSELALAGGFRWLGVRGVLTAKCLLGLFVVALLANVARRRGVTTIPLCTVLMLTAFSLHVFWLMRPQIATFVCLAVMVWLLDRAFANWQAEQSIAFRWLWAIPVLMAVWTNLHGGFVAGYAMLGAYLFVRVLELWRAAGVRDRRLWHLVAVGLATGVAMLANPYGHELIWWLAKSVTVPRPEISEWLPPTIFAPIFAPFFLLVLLSGFAWAGTRSWRDWAEGLVLLLACWQALSHMRHIALFATLAGFWVPGHFESCLERYRAIGPRWRVSLGYQRLAMVVCVSVCVASAFITYKRLGDYPVDRGRWPVDAIRFMAENDVQGRLIVNFNWAQYALSALPRTTVAFDGRFRTCYPQDIIDMHFDFIVGDNGYRNRNSNSPSFDPSRVLRYMSPELVLIDRGFEHAVSVLEKSGEFCLLYQDGLAQVWGLRSRFDERSSRDYVPAECRLIGDEMPSGFETWPALPEGDWTTPQT